MTGAAGQINDTTRTGHNVDRAGVGTGVHLLGAARQIGKRTRRLNSSSRHLLRWGNTRLFRPQRPDLTTGADRVNRSRAIDLRIVTGSRATSELAVDSQRGAQKSLYCRLRQSHGQTGSSQCQLTKSGGFTQVPSAKP